MDKGLVAEGERKGVRSLDRRRSALATCYPNDMEKKGTFEWR
jgi:hypothetical protein